MNTTGAGSARGQPVERRADRDRALGAERAPDRRRRPAAGRSRRWPAGSHHQPPSRSIRTWLDGVARAGERVGDRRARHDRDVVLGRRPAEQDDDRRTWAVAGSARSRRRASSQPDQSPTNTISGTSSTPDRSRATSPRTRSPRRRTSAAVPLPVVDDEVGVLLADRSRRRSGVPLSPASSIRPAGRRRRPGCGTRSRPTGCRAAGAPGASAGSRRAGP